MSTLWFPARAVGARGRRWWAWVVAPWVLTIPVLLVLAQSSLLAPLPGQAHPLDHPDLLDADTAGR